MYLAKEKAQISCAVSAQLIYAYVFAYAKTGFIMTRLIFRRGCYLMFQSERVETGILRGSLISSAEMSDGCASKFHQGLVFPPSHRWRITSEITSKLF